MAAASGERRPRRRRKRRGDVGEGGAQQRCRAMLSPAEAEPSGSQRNCRASEPAKRQPRRQEHLPARLDIHHTRRCDLTINPLEHLPEDAFRGFTQLQTLALPADLDCPGDSNMWDNVTTQGSNRICHSQRNPCNGSGGLGWLCPENSLCVPDGPGLHLCLCEGSYHGYKCLRQGTFPYLMFYGTLGAVTTSLSILLWVTQRRKVKAL